MLSHKLLDLPTLDTSSVWPVEFRYLGFALRIEYLTHIHSREGQELERFFHDFATGVRVCEPPPGDLFLISTREGYVDPDRDRPYNLPPAVDPIVFGIIESLVFVTPESKTLAIVHDEAPMPEGEFYFVTAMPDAMLAWDPEGQQLLVVDLRGQVLLVLREGDLGLSEENAMIVG